MESAMKRVITLFALAALAAACALDLPSYAAPAPSDKPRWEYAELHYRPPAPTFGKGAIDGQVEPPAVRPASIRWVTGDGEVDGKSWEDLGSKLKAPQPTKEASADARRVQLLNHLGSEGWELVSQAGGFGPTTTTKGTSTRTSGTAGTWLFKRRVP
jgi:hypothetical protein